MINRFLLSLLICQFSFGDIVPMDIECSARCGDFHYNFSDPALPFHEDVQMASSSGNSHHHLIHSIDMNSMATFLVQSGQRQDFLNTDRIFNRTVIQFFVTDDTTCYLSSTTVLQPLCNYYIEFELSGYYDGSMYHFRQAGETNDDILNLDLPSSEFELIRGHIYYLVYTVILDGRTPSFETSLESYINFSTDEPRPDPCIPPIDGDIDLDGTVGLSDLAVLLSNFGQTCR